MTPVLSLVPDPPEEERDAAPQGAPPAPTPIPFRPGPRPLRAGARALRALRRGAGRARRRLAAILAEDRGAVTAEYAVVIMAAVAFAGLLVAIMRSDEIRAVLVELVENALGTAG